MKSGKSKSKNSDPKRPGTSTSDLGTIGLRDLQKEELSGAPGVEDDTVTNSDENENEALGDGNIGRSKNDITKQ